MVALGDRDRPILHCEFQYADCIVTFRTRDKSASDLRALAHHTVTFSTRDKGSNRNNWGQPTSFSRPRTRCLYVYICESDLK